MNNHMQLKTGGDPRALSDYVSLRDELAKLSHPARPDVNWQRVEQLSLSLFRQNGVELQTVSWYLQARTRLTGIAGLNEGLVILEALLTNQWVAMWPQPAHARMEILSGLSQRLQSVLRTLTLSHADLPLIYLAERHLTTLCDVLQRLELKNASRMGELCAFMHNAATRIENMDENHCETPALVLPVSSGGTIAATFTAQPEPLVYVAGEVSSVPRVAIASPASGHQHPWGAFVAGMVTMLVVGSVGLWGWQKIYPEPVNTLPVTANVSSLKMLEHLPPLWRQEYGFTLANRAEPSEAEKLKALWQQSVSGNALPPEVLSGWHQGIEGLQELVRRLNELDERKGKYLTGSELKSMVFTIMQNFDRTVPVEEQLYQLSRVESGAPLPSALLLQTDMHLNQLLNRYTLIKQQERMP